MVITFNNVVMPSGIYVRTFGTSVLPPVDVSKVKIAGRAGQFNLMKSFGEREIVVDFFIMDNANETAYRAKIRTLARWLYSEEPAKFQIDSDPSVYWMAMVENDSSIDEQTDEIGVVSVTFIASQPFAISNTSKSASYTSGAATVTNSGDVDVAPQIEVNFTGDASFVELARTAGSDTKSMIIGSAVRNSELTTEQLFAQNTNQFTDPLTSTGTWTQLTANTYFNPSRNSDGQVKTVFTTVTETLAGSSQTGYGLTAGGTGTAGQFIGAACERTVTTDFPDFIFQCDFHLKKIAMDTQAKLELYFFGTNGSEIGKVNFGDTDIGRSNPQMWVRFGDANSYLTTTKALNMFTGSNAGVAQALNRNNLYYRNPDGLMRIRFARRGTNWRCWIATIDPTDTSYSRVISQDLFEFNDSQGVLNYQNIHKVRMTMSYAYGQTAPAAFVIHTAILDKNNEASYDPITHVPYIFHNGDKLLVDMAKAKIWLNGEEFYQYFDPSTSFWMLKKGSNSCIVLSNNSAVLGASTINFTERYL